MFLGRLVMHVQPSLESVRECEHIFEPHGMQGYGRFSRRPCTLFALVGAAALSHTHRSLHSAMSSAV